jgi:hypothetical protein
MRGKSEMVLGQNDRLVYNEQGEDHPEIERDGQILFHLMVGTLL